MIWHEKYFTVGNFELHIGKQIEEMAYLYSKDFKEVGVVEDIQITENKIIYKGRFLKCLLENKVIHKTKNFTEKSPEFICKNIVEEFAKQSIIVEPVLGIGTNISVQVTGDNLLEFIDKTLETQGLGCFIEYDYLNNIKIFRIFEGKDCTKTKAPLSKNYENIIDYTYNKSIKNVKNYAYVAGEEKDEKPRVIATVDISNGEEKRELWVDARDLQREQYNEDGSTTTYSKEEYLEMLRQRGIEKLAEYQIEETVDIEHNDSFEIGEKRIFKSGRILTEQRVTEIITAIENNTIKKDIVFGLQKLSKAEAIKREVSR